MTATGTPQDWKAIANEEHLLDGIEGKRLANIEMLLAEFPDDATRLIFLRYASDMNIQPDSGVILQMVMLMMVTTRMVEHRLKSEFGNVSEVVAQVERAAAQVAETTIQVLDRSHHLKNHTEAAAGRMEAIGNQMLEQAKEVVKTLESEIEHAAESKADGAVGVAVEKILHDRLLKLIPMLEGIEGGTRLIADEMKKTATSLGDAKAAAPIVIGGFQLNRMVLQWAAVFMLIGVLVGAGIARLVFPAPGTVTMTPQMLMRFQQGEAFQRWYAHQPATIRADVDRAFQSNALDAAANASPAP